MVFVLILGVVTMIFVVMPGMVVMRVGAVSIVIVGGVVVLCFGYANARVTLHFSCDRAYSETHGANHKANRSECKSCAFHHALLSLFLITLSLRCDSIHLDFGPEMSSR